MKHKTTLTAAMSKKATSEPKLSSEKRNSRGDFGSPKRMEGSLRKKNTSRTIFWNYTSK